MENPELPNFYPGYDDPRSHNLLTHRYTQLYRPPSSCTLPKGWTLVERPLVPGFERRRDLPISKHYFGVIEFDHALTQDEIADYQLKTI